MTTSEENQLNSKHNSIDVFNYILNQLPLDIVFLVYRVAFSELVSINELLSLIGKNPTCDSVFSTIISDSCSLTNWGRGYRIDNVKEGEMAFNSEEYISFFAFLKDRHLMLKTVDFYAFDDNFEQLYFIANSDCFKKIRVFIDFSHFVEDIPQDLLSLLINLSKRPLVQLEISVRQDDKNNHDFEFWPVIFEPLLPFVTQALTTVDDQFSEIVGFDFIYGCSSITTLDLVFYTHYGESDVFLVNPTLQYLKIDLSKAVTNYEFDFRGLPNLKKLFLAKVDCTNNLFEGLASSIEELCFDGCFYDDSPHNLPENLKYLTITNTARHPLISNLKDLKFLEEVNLDFDNVLPEEIITLLSSTVTKLSLKTKLDVPLDYTDDGYGGWIGTLVAMKEAEVYDLSILPSSLLKFNFSLTVQTDPTNEYKTEEHLMTLSLDYINTPVASSSRKVESKLLFLLADSKLDVDLNSLHFNNLKKVSFTPSCQTNILIDDVPHTFQDFEIDDPYEEYDVSVISAKHITENLENCGLGDYLTTSAELGGITIRTI